MEKFLEVRIKTYKEYPIYQHTTNWFKYRLLTGRMSPKSFNSVKEIEDEIDKNTQK